MFCRYSIWIGDTDRSVAGREIEQRRAVGRGRGQRHRLGVDIGDDAQPVAGVERARLRRNVGGRIVQSEKRLQPGSRDLGDHLARAVRVEAIDHHAVESVQHLELPRGFLRQFGNALGLADAAHHQPDHFAGVGVVLDHRGLRLDDQIDAGEMDRDVERLAAILQRHPENPFAGVRPGQIVDAGADGVDGRLRKHFLDRALKDIGAVAPEIVGDVFRSHADRKIGLQAEQESERLDAAGNMDRFAVAIGEIDLPVHDSAAACAKRSKAERADRTRSSSASSSA